MAKKKIHTDSLVELLETTKPEMLVNLIVELAEHRPDVRVECFEYLQKHLSLSPAQKSQSEGEIIMALWGNLYSELYELDEYGGGDYDKEDIVAGMMQDIKKILENSEVEEDARRALLDEVAPFIESGNAGMDDLLYDLAYATCQSDDDWLNLAEMLEDMNKDWPTDHARKIYRKLGDREKYLELRHKKLKYGDDYHDLAIFYWDEGSRNKAIAIAEEGMKNGQGRMDGVLTFLSDRALEDGNRGQYLALQFEQAATHLTLEKYNDFKKICSAEEWSLFEPEIVARLDTSWVSERLRIRMARKEYEEALALLLKGNYPSHAGDSCGELLTAKQLEARFPEEILTYYLSGLGHLNNNASRKEYARQAIVMTKVRTLLVDVMKDEARWKLFAGKVKGDNLRKPAFQEEFGKVIAEWGELVLA
ncbi:MAG: hypothetical protein JZU72_03190 [Chlorobium phaeobacteroides]|jgi:hypothetical protein|nr:hypothetical protein [Chlorobium phaeobacteroides]